MSLYVGHLSPRVRPEELERIFRRFGRCNLQLKDGYAFIVYEVTANAERALRALRGKVICGEHLSLNWSTRQPRSFQNSVRGGRFYEPYRRRNFRDIDYGPGIRGSQDRKDFVRARDPIHYRGGTRLDGMLDKGHLHDDVDESGRGKDASSKEGVVDEGVGGAGELIPVENDRWGGHTSHELSPDHEQENESDFGRYEPYDGYNKRHERENNHMCTTPDSRDQVSSPEKRHRGHSFDETERHFDKTKPEGPCCICGLVGHIMRNCPHADARRERLGKYSHRRDGLNSRVEDSENVKRLRPNSYRDLSIPRYNSRDRTKYDSDKKLRRVGRGETVRDSSKKIQVKFRADSQAKGKRKLENGALTKILEKEKTQRSGTSSDSSSSSSQSRSKSLGSSYRISSYSQSRSISSVSRSASSGSRSISASSYSKPPPSRAISKSRSRSNSRPSSLRSRSSSVSLDNEPMAPTQHIDTKVPLKTNLEHVPSPESNRVLTSSGNLDAIHRCSKLKEEHIFARFNVDAETNRDHPGSNGDNAHYSSCRAGDLKNDTLMDAHKDTDMASENQGDIDVTSKNVGETTELQGDAGAKLNTQVSPTKISSEEMLSALKHYGIATPEGGESGISMEAFFGAARMWPWELVYYRRLRKGPISTENYARRLEQNREFGIVDRYVRSSSGWGERHLNDSGLELFSWTQCASLSR